MVTPFLKWGLQVLLTATTLLLIYEVPALGQVINCPAIALGNELKVVLDDLSYTKPALQSDEELKTVMERLYWMLSSRVRGLKLEMGPEVSLVRCDGRKPRGGQDFDRRLVERLNMSNVVLEIWGTLDAQVSQAGRISQRLARVGYLVVPLRHYERGAGLGLYQKTYAEEQSASIGSPVAYVDLLKEAREIDAYVSAGIGVKSLKAKDYDVGLRYLCKADIMFKSDSGHDPILANYVSEAVSKAIDLAKNDPNYSGSIKLVRDEKLPCGDL